ncbi:MAG: aminoglycoside phosphotransferase family protein [Bacteroidota bacterium]
MPNIKYFKTLINHLNRVSQLDTFPTSQQIKNLGSVNQVYELQTKNQAYILRFNEAPEKVLEFKKEDWCLDQMISLGIPSPSVIYSGIYKDCPYQILQKLPGKNGSLLSEYTQLYIWEKLGQYARQFHQIQSFQEVELQQAEFHEDWKARLHYNLQELNVLDPLLQNGVLKKAEHQDLRSYLEKLLDKNFQTGLVHGDLCPRNTILDADEVYLIDWGTARIDVVPHLELGQIMRNEKTDPAVLEAFLNGYELSDQGFQNIIVEIQLLDMLHMVDVYRWALSHAPEQIKRYEQGVRTSLQGLVA